MSQANKTVLIFNFVILDADGVITNNGVHAAGSESEATIALARKYPTVKPSGIILQQWTKQATVRDLDAIATVRVVEGSLSPAPSTDSPASKK